MGPGGHTLIWDISLCRYCSSLLGWVLSDVLLETGEPTPSLPHLSVSMDQGSCHVDMDMERPQVPSFEMPRRGTQDHRVILSFLTQGLM